MPVAVVSYCYYFQYSSYNKDCLQKLLHIIKKIDRLLCHASSTSLLLKIQISGGSNCPKCMSRMNTLNKYRTKSKSFCHRKDYIYYDGYEFVIRIDKVHRQVKYFDRRNYSSIKTHQRNNEEQLCAVIGIWSIMHKQ